MQRSPRLDDLQLWNVYKKKREEKFRAGHPSFSSCLLFIAAPPFFWKSNLRIICIIIIIISEKKFFCKREWTSNRVMLYFLKICCKNL